MSAPRTPPTAGTSASGMLAGNLLLALGWVAMSGHFDVVNLLVGFVFGYIVLYLLQRVIGRSRYFTRTLGLLRFIGFYIVEVVRANLRVAFDVVTPTDYAKPGIEELTEDDYITSQFPYSYRAERFRTFFYNICSADNGRRSARCGSAWSVPTG